MRKKSARIWTLCIFAVIVAVIGGVMAWSKFFSQSIVDYAAVKPELRIEEFFNGSVKGWGIVQDFRGVVRRKFELSIVGTWNGQRGTLDENFLFDDGERQSRIWLVEKIDDRKYSGTAGDIIGAAAGEINGNSARWFYKMDLPVAGKIYRVSFDDWMYLIDDRVLINRSYIKKFGFTIAELTIVMQKNPAQP